jgi:hypothetical protein
MSVGHCPRSLKGLEGLGVQVVVYRQSIVSHGRTQPNESTIVCRVSDTVAINRQKSVRPSRRRQFQDARIFGRAKDAERNDGIARMISAGQSWSSIQAATGCSRATIAKIAKRAKTAA